MVYVKICFRTFYETIFFEMNNKNMVVSFPFTGEIMKYVSAFLAHSSVDKHLVKLVARELGRRGVIPWLDINELHAGADLGASLRNAVFEQTAVIAFLSRDAIASPWIEDELFAAIEKDKEHGNSDRIIPVYLGDPITLVSLHELLRARWLHVDGDRVDRKGIVLDMSKDDSQKAREIAKQASKMIYHLLDISKQRDIVIYLDQRGEGKRQGRPNISKNLDKTDASVLVFRPAPGRREQGETLSGTDWDNFRDDMKEALGDALGGVRWADKKNIRILGGAQLALPYFLGSFFNRNSSANLFCYNIEGPPFSNQKQERATPLQGGNPNCETPHTKIEPIISGDEVDEIALILAMDRLVPPVLKHLETLENAPHPVWVKSKIFNDSEEVMDYISDVVALLDRLVAGNGLRKVYLYSGLPFHATPLLAANMLHVAKNIVVMEHRRDLDGKDAPDRDMYSPLKIL